MIKDNLIGLEEKVDINHELETVIEVAAIVSEHRDLQSESYRKLVINHMSFKEKIVYFAMSAYENIVSSWTDVSTENYLGRKVDEKNLAPKILDQLACQVKGYLNKKENEVANLDRDLKEWKTLQEHYELEIEELPESMSSCLKDIISLRKENGKIIDGRLSCGSKLMGYAKALSKSMVSSLEKYCLIEEKIVETERMLGIEQRHYVKAEEIYAKLEKMAGSFKREEVF